MIVSILLVIFHTLNLSIVIEANRVAHELASLVKGSLCNRWLEEAPAEIIPVMIDDVTIVTS